VATRRHIAFLLQVHFYFTQILEDPLEDKDRHTFEIGKTYRHVSIKGREQVDVILHGASYLPNTADGGQPIPYGIV